jgi:hypothetical protein
VEAGLAELAKAGNATASPRSEQRLGELLQRAMDLGLLDDLPPDLAEALAKGQQNAAGGGDPQGMPDVLGQLDPSRLGLTPEQTERLLQALAKNVQGRLGNLAQCGRIPREELQDLGDILAERGRGDSGASQPNGIPGRGGLDRGRADAPLHFTHETQGDKDELKAEKLPPGVGIPDEWQVLGVGRAEPEVDPRRASPAGGVAGAVDGTGQAAWQRRLAPRHRDAVRGFFTKQDK